MRDELSGPGSVSLRRAEDPWHGFEQTLSSYLRRSERVGAMEFSAPSESTAGQGRCLVRLAADGAAWVSLRRAGSTLTEEMITCSDPADPARLGRAVTDACRDRLGIPHPQLVTLRCEGPVGRRAEALGLIGSDAVPVGQDPADDPSPIDVAVEVDGHEDARERYESLVERVTGRPCVVDDDGRLVFDHVGHRVHIEFTEDLPYARIWAWVVRGVRSRSEAALEIAGLNNQNELTTWVLEGRHVRQRTTVPVAPFLPRHAQAALENFLFAFASTRAGVAAKLGPR